MYVSCYRLFLVGKHQKKEIKHNIFNVDLNLNLSTAYEIVSVLRGYNKMVNICGKEI